MKATHPSLPFRRLIVGCCALLLLSLPNMTPSAHAQTAGGVIEGTITDSQSGVLSDTVVVVVNQATSVETKVPTNHDGNFRFANLPAGAYTMTVTHDGFATVKKTIAVNVGENVVSNIVMKPGAVDQTVQVEADLASVDLAAAAISYNVPGPEIRELPLNGRDYTSLAILQPGVASIGTAGGLRTGLGNKLAVSGGRPQTNNYFWDGISLNDNGNNAPGSVLGVTLGVEAVDQFTLLTNSFSAEYGNTAGGVLNAVTRSGTNNLHGSGFLFARNSAMDAANYFDVPGKRPQFHRYQYGGTMGGPLFKDKTFWFFDYEGVNQGLGTTVTSVVPTTTAKTGLLHGSNCSAGTPSTTSCQVSIDPNVAPALALYPDPNSTILTPDTGNFVAIVDQVGKEQYYFGKIDHKFSEKDTVRGNYFYDNGTLAAPDNLNDVVSQQQSIRQGIGLEYTRMITPAIVNVARVGVTRSVQISGTVVRVNNPAVQDTALAQIPGKDSGSISIGGFQALPTGPLSTDHNYEKFNTFQEYENLYITKGIQTIKVGADAERLDDNLFLPTASGGQYSFASLPTFFANNPSGWTGMTLDSDMKRGERQTIYGFYVQDDVRLRPTLTVNVGFRYEFTTIPTEVNGKIAILHNLHDTTVRVGGSVLDTNPSLKDFSPRIGVSWDPFGKGKTSVRGGFGEFDNLILQNQYDMILSRSLPLFKEGVFTSSTTPGLKGSFPGGAYQLISGATTTLRTDYIDPNPPRSYTMQWNFNIQQELKGWIGQVGYVGARGVHLSQTERNMNSVFPSLVNGVYTYPTTASTTNKLNRNFSTINCTDTFNTDSDYSSLQISVHRPLTKGLLVQGSYTWAKSIDDSSSTSSVQAGTGYPNAIGNPEPLLPSINRALSDFDIASNGIVSVVYNAPGPHDVKTWMREATNGWEIGDIFHMQSGFPFSAILNNDIANTLTDTTGTNLGQRPNYVPGCKFTNPASVTNYINVNCFTAPTFGTLGALRRNALRAPGIIDMDFSLLKNNKFGDRANGQLRIEFFNVLNHPNFSAPAFTIFTGGNATVSSSGVQTVSTPTRVSNAGQITSTTTSSRQLQLGYKVTF